MEKAFPGAGNGPKVVVTHSDRPAGVDTPADASQALGQDQRPVVVAVGAVVVVQVLPDEVVHVIAVRDRFVTAVRSVDVIVGVFRAVVRRRAAIVVGGANGDDVLVDMRLMRVVQVAIVEVVGVSIVGHRGVSAARSVCMGVVGVNAMFGHSRLQSGAT